jgi:hypothetical protein
MSWFKINDAKRRSNSLILGEYDAALKKLTKAELERTFDSMTAIVLGLKLNDKDEQLALNGLDLIAQELYSRKLNIH